MRTISPGPAHDGVPQIAAGHPTHHSRLVRPGLRRPENGPGRRMVAGTVAVVLVLLAAAVTQGVMIHNRNRALASAQQFRPGRPGCSYWGRGARPSTPERRRPSVRRGREVAAHRRQPGSPAAHPDRAARCWLALRLQETLAGVAGIQGQNQVFSVALGEEASRLTTTKQCLLGVRRALDQAAVADFAGSVASLRAVDSQCTATLAHSKEAIGYPAYDGDFPDPSIVQLPGRYYGYATNGRAGTVQLLTGCSLDALTITATRWPKPAAWAERGGTWAPAGLAARPPLGDVLHGPPRGSGTECIARARSRSRPAARSSMTALCRIVCQPDLGGSDRSEPVRRRHRPAVAAVEERGTAGEAPTRIWSQTAHRRGDRRRARYGRRTPGAGPTLGSGRD